MKWNSNMGKSKQCPKWDSSGTLPLTHLSSWTLFYLVACNIIWDLSSQDGLQTAPESAASTARDYWTSPMQSHQSRYKLSYAITCWLTPKSHPGGGLYISHSSVVTDCFFPARQAWTGKIAPSTLAGHVIGTIAAQVLVDAEWVMALDHWLFIDASVHMSRHSSEGEVWSAGSKITQIRGWPRMIPRVHENLRDRRSEDSSIPMVCTLSVSPSHGASTQSTMGLERDPDESTAEGPRISPIWCPLSKQHENDLWAEARNTYGNPRDPYFTMAWRLPHCNGASSKASSMCETSTLPLSEFSPRQKERGLWHTRWISPRNSHLPFWALASWQVSIRRGAFPTCSRQHDERGP